MVENSEQIRPCKIYSDQRVELVDKLAVGFFVTFASSLILFDIDMTN